MYQALQVRDDILKSGKAIRDEEAPLIRRQGYELPGSHGYAIKAHDIAYGDLSRAEYTPDGDCGIGDPYLAQQIVEGKDIEKNHECQGHQQNRELEAGQYHIYEDGYGQKSGKDHGNLQVLFYLVNPIHVYYAT